MPRWTFLAPIGAQKVQRTQIRPPRGRGSVPGGRGRRRFRLLLGLLRLFGRLAVAAAAVLRRRRAVGRPSRALLLAVVGVVEARALEVDRDRVEDAVHRRPADLALRDRVVAHALEHLEGVALLAAVLVDRHGTLSIGVPAGLKAASQAARRASPCGGAGAGSSSSRETRIDCHTSQAATWPVARSASETIAANLPHARDGWNANFRY